MLGLAALAVCLCSCREPAGQQGKSEHDRATARLVSAQAGVRPYQPGSALPTFDDCNLESVGNTQFDSQPLMLQPGDIQTFKGWIVSGDTHSATYWLRFDDQQANRYLRTPLQLTIERLDVVAAHHDAPRVSGFAVTIPANALPGGQYHAYIAVDSGGTTYTCDSGRRVDVAH
jgi:hypothetical protein